MANRKEDEKNERTIRNLLKLSDNRRCINCNSLGPQYVCTNFWTFVCTNCSGIHREFTHRVKSISMSKFTSQEVSALQGGGNASAKEIYFKEWDPQRQSPPDGSNAERLRDFIKHVYVERRYTGERSFEKPPRAKMGETGDLNDRRADSYQSGSRSPPYEDSNERRYSDRQGSGGRSPGYDQENRQYGDSKRSPARTEMVNDWRREERFGNGRRSEDSRISDGGSSVDGRSSDRQRDLEASSPPMVRPVRDILGENVTPLRVIEPPKANGARPTDGSIRTQRTSSSSSLASSNGNPAELKTETSLIDFDSVPEPPVHAAVPKQQPAAVVMPVAQTTPPGGGNWANFDSVSEVKAPVNTNPLESVLFDLSVPASVSGNTVGTPGSGSALTMASAGNISALPRNSPVAPLGLPFGSVPPAATAVNNLVAFPTGIPAAAPGPITSQPIPGGNLFGNATTVGQWSQSQQHSVFPAMGGQPLLQQYNSTAVGPSGNQPWNSLLAQNSQGLPSTAPVQAAPQVIKPAMEVSSGVATENSSGQVKSGGRNELPEDLFAVNYSSFSAPVPGWHTGPPHGMGFATQYNVATLLPSVLQASKSTNPFDVNNDSSPTPTFPSMASLQGALPTMTAAGGLLRTSSLGVPVSHPSALLPRSQPYGAMMHSNTYMGQQLPSNMPPRPHGQVNFGPEGAAFGSLNANQQLGGFQSAPAPAAPNTFSSIGGNPFG